MEFKKLTNAPFSIDPLKTRHGYLHLKAYRLTPQAVAFYKENDFGVEAIKNHHLSFENLYQVFIICIIAILHFLCC